MMLYTGFRLCNKSCKMQESEFLDMQSDVNGIKKGFFQPKLRVTTNTHTNSTS